MLNRPTFIFADENHQSPFLSNLLAQLAPQFKQAGFHHFYYEYSSEFSREQLIKHFKDQIALFEAGKTLLPEIKKEILDYLPQPVPSRVLGFNLDFMNLNDLHYDMLILHFSNIMRDKKDTPYEFYLLITLAALQMQATEIGKNNMTRAVVEKQLTRMVKEFNLPTASAEANIRMLQIIAENHIEYKGVDDAVLTRHLTGGNTLSQTLDSIQAMQDMLVTLDQRNKTMIRAYLQSRAPVIGFTGMLHVTGMQKLLTTMIPEDIAKANYHFIYVYREPLDGAPELNKLREEMRTGKLALPLGVILIDGMNKTEEEIAAEVMLRINEKIAAYDALPDQLKLIPDISFTGQVRAQLGHLFGIFNRTKDSVYQTTVDATAKVRNAVHL